jgi:hypothetical protein
VRDRPAGLDREPDTALDQLLGYFRGLGTSGGSPDPRTDRPRFEASVKPGLANWSRSRGCVNRSVPAQSLHASERERLRCTGTRALRRLPASTWPAMLARPEHVRRVSRAQRRRRHAHNSRASQRAVPVAASQYASARGHNPKWTFTGRGTTARAVPPVLQRREHGLLLWTDVEQPYTSGAWARGGVRTSSPSVDGRQRAERLPALDIQQQTAPRDRGRTTHIPIPPTRPTVATPILAPFRLAKARPARVPPTAARAGA